MIRIHRPSAPPDAKTAASLAEGQRQYAKFKSTGAKQTRFDFLPRYWGQAKKLLMEIQHEKCAYCESRIGVISDGVLENFRPKSKYPELAYEWNNLLLSCDVCSANKRERFPTNPDGSPLLVNPFEEDPDPSIKFDREGRAIAGSAKGEVTIEIIALNRQHLVKTRERSIREYSDPRKDRPGDEAEYAGAIRCVLDAGAAGPLPQTRSGMDLKTEEKTKPAPGRTAVRGRKSVTDAGKEEFSYITSIHIRNFRAITELKLTFPPYDGAPVWQVLLGENAVGKSTVLKALAITLMGSGHLPPVNDYQEGILRRYAEGKEVRQSESGFVEITFVNEKKAVLEISNSGLRFTQQAAGMKGTIRGYGSMRLLPDEDDEENAGPVMANTGNLFHPKQCLVNAEKLLVRMHAAEHLKFEQFATHIRYLLRLQGELVVEGGKLLIPINGTPVRIAELSDGYQAMMALAVDLMNSFEDHTKIASDPGILLLDELGTHLHPRWKMEFVERLRSTFRGLQVIATTHEPLCLRGLKKGEAGVLYREASGNVELLHGEELPDIEGMRVDQILTSSIFGLHSTIEPSTEDEFVRYYDLLARRDLTPAELAQKNALARKLKPHRHLAYTRRDQMMYEAIDEFLAEEANLPKAQRPGLKAETMQRLRDIWQQDGLPKGGGETP